MNGCYPTLVERTDEAIALYQQYLPLFAQFRRRVFCFEPDPMRPPKDSRGKLFTVGEDYVAGNHDRTIDVGDHVNTARRRGSLFRVQRGHDVGKVGVMFPGDGEFRDVRFKFDGTFLAVPLKEYMNCAVVKLFVTERAARASAATPSTADRASAATRDSAFEDISWR